MNPLDTHARTHTHKKYGFIKLKRQRGYPLLKDCPTLSHCQARFIQNAHLFKNTLKILED